MDEQVDDILDQAQIDQFFEAILGAWGTGADLDLVAPTVAVDDNFRGDRKPARTAVRHHTEAARENM